MTLISLLIFSATVPKTAYCQSPPPTDPYVYVLVWRYYNPYDSLCSAVSTYKQDLENAGFSVELIFRPYLPGDAEGIRELLQNEALTHEIVGVLMVGDVPYANYEMEIEGYNYTFPCDLYHMDLDGNWTDSDGNEVYDGHSSGEGDLEPEIWVGRLYASTMTGDEDELLINYFDKNHRFRTGELTLPRRAIAYIDDDFANFASFVDPVNSSLRMIYGDKTTLVTDPEITSAAHYKKTLNDTLGYEWLLLASHGNYKKHAFRATPTSYEYVYSSEIRSIDPHAFFYNIMACDTADYTCRNFSSPNYIGGSYIFADTYGLLVVGCTKPHGLWNVTDFYEPIAKGKCIGQAFKEWFEKNGELDRITSYGMIILGDPALRAGAVESGWLTFPVTFDGKMTTAKEWSDTIPVDLALLGWHGGPITVSARVWIKNDNTWLYLLYRVEWSAGDTDPLDRGYIANFWDWIGEPPPLWNQSDGSFIEFDGVKFDVYGWDETRWYNDTDASPSGENNVEGVATHDGTYYWFEFRKELNSGDGYDWGFTPGQIIETVSQVHDLLVGVWDNSTRDAYQAYISLHLSTQLVRGIWIPVNKLELLAPYIGLTILLAVAVTTVVYVKKKKRDTEINS